jgi:hypothetical protein
MLPSRRRNESVRGAGSSDVRGKKHTTLPGALPPSLSDRAVTTPSAAVSLHRLYTTAHLALTPISGRPLPHDIESHALTNLRTIHLAGLSSCTRRTAGVPLYSAVVLVPRAPDAIGHDRSRQLHSANSPIYLSPLPPTTTTLRLFRLFSTPTTPRRPRHAFPAGALAIASRGAGAAHH